MLAVKHLGQLDQRDIHLLLNRTEDNLAVSLDAMRALVAAFGFGGRGTSGPNSRTQRTAVATLTPKRSAAARRDVPPSTTVIRRERRSWDKVFAMLAGLLVQPAW